jgi:uncharacterized protein (TIGR02466 family)
MSESSLNPVQDMATNGRIENLFSTPLFSHALKNVDALNAELRDLILERERTTPSAAKSNIGGWQSQADFLTWGGSAVSTLGRYLVTAVEIATAKLPLVAPNLKIHFELMAWAAVNRKGHYNTSHVHPMATWSGVYYVDPGDEPQDGAGAVLEFEHPIQAMVMNFFPGLLPSSLVVRPEAGLVVLFPSSLVHNVRIYQGERPRICVSFNARPRIEAN